MGSVMANLPWVGLYVKPRHEKNVSAILQGKGYEAFLPTYTHRVKYNKTFELPLFPSYVFCRMEPRNTLAVVSTPGVFSILTNGHGPEPIPEDDIEGLKRMLESGSPTKPWPYVLPGQEVLVESGPFKGVRGVVTDTTDSKWLVISVNLLQRSAAVRLDRDSLSVKVHPRTR
jgi:transcription antitermination factor NusG